MTIKLEPDKNEASLRTSNIICLILFLFGLTQILGYITNNNTLRGLGAASLLAPLPKVFSDVDGLETFASDFYILEKEEGREIKRIQITPELYSKIKGPYTRRNVYGAALSYAPRLPKSLWQPVFNYGFKGALLEELGLPINRSYEVLIVTKTKGRSDSWIIKEDSIKKVHEAK